MINLINVCHKCGLMRVINAFLLKMYGFISVQKTLKTGCVCLVVFCTATQASAQTSAQVSEQILADKKLDSVYTMSLDMLKKGFNAGDGYPQVWIRDFNTFIEASLKVYSRDSIRNNLLNFLRLQQPNGEIVDGYVLKGHVTWGDPNQYFSVNDPHHVGFKNTVETDQETSLIQAFAKYIRLTGDRSILSEKIAAKTALQRLEEALAYLQKERWSGKYGLLKGATTQDWGDVQFEGGETVDVDDKTHWCVDIYDNAMLVIALNDMAGFYPTAASGERWRKMSLQTKTNIRKYLWDNKRHKFIPHVYLDKSPFPASFQENDIYFHGGTAVAVEAGILSKAETIRAYEDMIKNVKASGAPSIGLTLYPVYPENIYPGSKANKEYNYQNGGDWTWFGARMVKQLAEKGYVKEAYAALQPMIERSINDKGLFEWYGKDGTPHGSAAFKGSAGVLISAIDALKKQAALNK